MSSISNGREGAAVLKNYVGMGRSQTARWANAAYRFANSHCNSIADTYVTSADCTDLYSALVDASTLPGRVDAGREDGGFPIGIQAPAEVARFAENGAFKKTRFSTPQTYGIGKTDDFSCAVFSAPGFVQQNGPSEIPI